jgi:mevalonate kinase
VIEFVENQRANTKDKFKALFDRIDVCTMFANSALNDNNWNALGNALNRGQLMMEMLGVCDQHLQNIIDSLTAHEQISGAKISGSGLGDCVIGIGSFSPPADWPYEIIPVQLSARGLEQES